MRAPSCIVSRARQIASSPVGGAENADRIMTMLATTTSATVAHFGANNSEKVKKDSLLTDSSTTDPAVSKELAKEVEKMGVVSGGRPAGSETLMFMVGAVTDEFLQSQSRWGAK